MTKLLMKLRNRKGFTLIELIVVIAILGILAAILIPQFTGFQNKARESQALVSAKQIATAIDSFFAENNAWPASAADNAEVIALAGTPAGGWVVGDDADTLGDGGFGWSVTVGGTAYTAGRVTTGAVVAPNPN